MSTPAGDDLIGGARIRVDADTDPALRALRQFSRDADGRLRDMRGRFVSESALINASLTRAAGGGDRFGLSLRGLTSIAGRLGPVLGRVGLGIGAIGAAAGTAAPLLAGIVTTLENIAPAGAVAVTGMLAVQQASAAIKLGMVGVEEAVTSAFDSSEKGAKKFDEALKKLSPQARAFALQVKELQPQFQKLQQGIQNRLFRDLADELDRLASAALPTVQRNLNQTANTLNRMAQGASGAARALATNGTLGQAMAGANRGLINLRQIPGQVVTALGQLAAAGAPAFDRITAGAAGFATSISQKLSAAFESGALTEAVDTAVGLLKDLGTVGANVFTILGNVMAPVQAAGGGLIGTLKEITGALAEATGTKAFQDAISAVAQVMGTLARTVGPLLGQALAAIGPIFTTLGPPIERLITSLGAALSPIIAALGPVLATAADAVGILVDAISPLLPIVGDLIASLLPPLVPMLQSFGTVLAQAGPVVQLLGQALATALAPILAQLPTLVQPFAQVLTTLAQTVLPIVARLIVALAPSLASLGQSFAQILVAAAPLLQVLAQLAGQTLAQLAPAMVPIITLTAQLAALFASQLATAVTAVIIPAIQALTALLNGDFSSAWQSLRALVGGVVTYFTTTLSNLRTAVGGILRGIVSLFEWLYNVLIGNSIIPDLVTGIAAWFGRLAGLVLGPLERFRTFVIGKFTAVVAWAAGFPARMAGALAALGGQIVSVATGAFSRFRAAVVAGGVAAVAAAAAIPGRIRAGLGALGSYLYGAGQDLIRGMINGVRAMAGSLVSAAKSVVGSAVEGAKSLLGISSPSKVFAEIGRNVGRGFIIGLTGTKSKIDQTADRMVSAITSAFKGKATKVDDRLVALVEAGNKKLQSLAGQRDALSARIQQAQKFATDLAASTASGFSLQSIAGEGPVAPIAFTQGLANATRSIKAFTTDVSRLQKLGLRKDLIQQILNLGVEQGSQLADTLAKQSPAYIKQLNRMQANVVSASANLGRLGADALFDAGKKAGDGFLTGLKAQRKSIEDLMVSIASSIQKAIKKALGIKSPSRVFAEIGRNTVRGLSEGLLQQRSAAADSVRAVADSVTGAGVDTLGSLVGVSRTQAPAGSQTFNLTLQVTNAGIIASQREMDNWLAAAVDRLRIQGRLPMGAAA